MVNSFWSLTEKANMEFMPVIASEAKQSSFVRRRLDCFVATLLAMTT
jgi:hypothetical protein